METFWKNLMLIFCSRTSEPMITWWFHSNAKLVWCKTCHFCNIMLRDPGQSSANNLEMMDMMQQANLDACWSLVACFYRTIHSSRGGLDENENEIWNALCHSSHGTLAVKYQLGNETKEIMKLQSSETPLLTQCMLWQIFLKLVLEDWRILLGHMRAARCLYLEL